MTTPPDNLRPDLLAGEWVLENPGGDRIGAVLMAFVPPWMPGDFSPHTSPLGGPRIARVETPCRITECRHPAFDHVVAWVTSSNGLSLETADRTIVANFRTPSYLSSYRHDVVFRGVNGLLNLRRVTVHDVPRPDVPSELFGRWTVRMDDRFWPIELSDKPYRGAFMIRDRTFLAENHMQDVVRWMPRYNDLLLLHRDSSVRGRFVLNARGIMQMDVVMPAREWFGDRTWGGRPGLVLRAQEITLERP